MAKLIISKKAQQKDIKKAQQVLTQLEAGAVKPRVSKKHQHLTLECGIHCRLLSRDCGKHYELMSHEAYNKAIDKK